MAGTCRLAALLLLCALASVILAQPSDAAASAWATGGHGAARLISAVEATGKGDSVDIGLQLRLSPGWHTYWRTPGDGGFAPSIDWKGSSNLKSATIAWPAPVRLPPLGGLESVGYVNGVVLPISVRVLHPGAPLHLHAEVDYASCREVCIPYHARLDLTLPSGLARPGPEAALLATAQARVPGGLATAGLVLKQVIVGQRHGQTELVVNLISTGAPLRAPDLFVEGIQKGSPGRPGVVLTQGGHLASIRLPVRDGAADAIAGARLVATVVDGARAAQTQITPVLGILPAVDAPTLRIDIVGLALLGGLILNLMPCVLPVLSLKLLAVTGYSGSERRTARLGLLATSGGIVVSFLLLAGTLIGLKQVGATIGWGIQFQQPWFLATMALITTVFAASLWELLPIGLPGAVAGAVGSIHGRSRMGDAFLMGAFATLLAASCSAPFVGTAIGFALARGPLDIVLVFSMLGLGMAAPFLAVAAAPGVVAYLPRPGRWMVWLRRVLGFALLATAVWLLSILAIEVDVGVALASGATLAALLMTLALRKRLPSRVALRRGANAAIGMLALLTITIPSLHGRAAVIDTPASNNADGLWRPFKRSSLHSMVARGQVVFVDVSAAWCLTCKVNEATVLDRSPVANRLKAPGVVAMRADWTRASPAITAYLQSFGRYGVPFDVVYGPGAPAGIPLPELLTADTVMRAMHDAARVTGGTATKSSK